MLWIIWILDAVTNYRCWIPINWGVTHRFRHWVISKKKLARSFVCSFWGINQKTRGSGNSINLAVSLAFQKWYCNLVKVRQFSSKPNKFFVNWNSELGKFFSNCAPRDLKKNETIVIYPPPPENQHGTWTWWFLIGISSSRGSFSGSMLVFRGVYIYIKDMGLSNMDQRLKPNKKTLEIKCLSLYHHSVYVSYCLLGPKWEQIWHINDKKWHNHRL